LEDLGENLTMLDLVIVGGGPAGTAAALEAKRRGLRVAIWEQGRFPRHKVCGEFISAEALPWLQLAIPQALSCGAVIDRAEFVFPSGFTRGFNLPSPARGLSRHLLDAALWKAAAEAGVEAHEGEGVRRVRRWSGSGEGGLWELESAGGSIERAKALIVACGRWWRMEGFPSPARARAPAGAGKLMGVKAHFAGIDLRGNVEMYLFRNGYCGLAPIEDGKYNLCCLIRSRGDSDARGLRNLSAWIARAAHHPGLEARLSGVVQVSPAVVTTPVRLERRGAAEGGALLAGDASGFLDPFTGEGISMALHSGRLAGEAVAEGFASGRDAERAAEVYQQRLELGAGRSYRMAALARTLLGAPAWTETLLAAPLPWLASLLLRQTRWRMAPADERSPCN
jgi:flavin-dependent dehydrogenase